MSDLKRQLIKLGSTNPGLRPHIREILASTKEASSTTLEKMVEVEVAETVARVIEAYEERLHNTLLKLAKSMGRAKVEYPLQITVYQPSIPNPVVVGINPRVRSKGGKLDIAVDLSIGSLSVSPTPRERYVFAPNTTLSAIEKEVKRHIKRSIDLSYDTWLNS